jgi:hypothetical protein
LFAVEKSKDGQVSLAALVRATRARCGSDTLLCV